MNGHTVTFRTDPTGRDARCSCGWEAHSADHAAVSDAAERHAWEVGGTLVLAGLAVAS